METPSRQRVVIDLVSDDGEDAAHIPRRNEVFGGRNFEEFPGFLIDELPDAGPSPWEAEYALLGRGGSPIFGDWGGDFIPPVVDQVNWPDFLQQAEIPNPIANPRGHNNYLFDDNVFLPQVISPHPETANATAFETRQELARERVRGHSPGYEMCGKAECLKAVIDIFPDICRDHLDQLYDHFEGKKTVGNIAEAILEGIEGGEAYPTINKLKRKHSTQEEEMDDAQKFMSPDQGEKSLEYKTAV